VAHAWHTRDGRIETVRKEMHALKGQRETTKDVMMWHSETYAKPECGTHLRRGTRMQRCETILGESEVRCMRHAGRCRGQRRVN
jgi:hypothetical protein